MKRRVFGSMAVLAFMSAAVTAVLFWVAFGLIFANRAADNLRDVRVTIIGRDGVVTFDNKYDIAEMENHADYPEVARAFESGAGEETRFSDEAGATAHFYAERLADKTVLRLSLTDDGVARWLGGLAPAALMCSLAALVIVYFAARSFTAGVVRPINEMRVDESVEPPYDELLPLVRKIREQREEISAQNSRIERSDGDLGFIADNMREGLLLVDGKGMALMANKSAAAILKADVCVGVPVGALCRDAGFLAGVRESLAGKDAEVRLEWGRRIYAVSFSPAPPTGVVVLFIDITEKSAAERQRREFTADVSHELKTPLTTIMGWAEMIEGGSVKDGDIRPFAGRIKASAERLLAVAEDVIKLSEFDEGLTERRFAPFSLLDAACAVKEGLDDGARKRGVELSVKGEDFNVLADRRLIEELIRNLADNAVKYNKEGGRAEIAVERRGDKAFIIVSDTGVGLAEEHLPRVFERFYRVDKSRSKDTGGTGLGLSIVKHIAEFHGGGARIESRSGEGCVVTCFIAG